VLQGLFFAMSLQLKDLLEVLLRVLALVPSLAVLAVAVLTVLEESLTMVAMLVETVDLECFLLFMERHTTLVVVVVVVTILMVLALVMVVGVAEAEEAPTRLT
jgi:hypothetical protein